MNVVREFQGEYRFLSNFWFVKVWLGGIQFPTTEHAYQAAKTLDIPTRRKIALLGKPGDAKRASKGVPLRSDWEDVKEDIMLDLLRSKFANADLARRLLATGDMELQEGNSWGDTYWGICRGVGKNRLGHLLMQVRSELIP